MRARQVSVFLIACGLATTGQAQDVILVPYHGHVERGGSPQDGLFDFQIGLFDSDLASTSCLADADLSGCGEWADGFTDVVVVGGEFSLLLGESVELDPTLFDSDLYLGIALRTGSESFVVLSGLQRFAAVPASVRARRAMDFEVSGTLGIGTDSPQTALHVEEGRLRVRGTHNNYTADIAQFYANNLSQGVGIGYNRIEALGSAANQDLLLIPRGSGRVQVHGPLEVLGDTTVLGVLSQRAIRYDGSETFFYQVDQPRFLVEAAYTTLLEVRSYTQIPQATLESMCGDDDGCRLTLRMKNWAGNNGSYTTKTATSISFHFQYGTVEGDNAAWRREDIPDPPNTYISIYDVSGNDGDDIRRFVARNHDCYFTDAFYLPGSNIPNDNGLGMGLLNVRATGGPYFPLCQLIIDD